MNGRLGRTWDQVNSIGRLWQRINQAKQWPPARWIPTETQTNWAEWEVRPNRQGVGRVGLLSAWRHLAYHFQPRSHRIPVDWNAYLLLAWETRAWSCLAEETGPCGLFFTWFASWALSPQLSPRSSLLWRDGSNASSVRRTPNGRRGSFPAARPRHGYR